MWTCITFTAVHFGDASLEIKLISLLEYLAYDWIIITQIFLKFLVLESCAIAEMCIFCNILAIAEMCIFCNFFMISIAESC